MRNSTPIFRIRPMEGRDIPTIVGLDRRIFRDPWPESAYVQEVYFNPHAHYFVLELLDLRWPCAQSGEVSIWGRHSCLQPSIKRSAMMQR